MPRTYCASDLGIDLDSFEARRSPREWVYITGVGPWDASDDAEYRDGEHECPACGRMRGDPPVSPVSRYCLRCDSAGLDGRIGYPGEPVGSRIDPDYVPDVRGEAYRPDPLAGVARTRKERRGGLKAG